MIYELTDPKCIHRTVSTFPELLPMKSLSIPALHLFVMLNVSCGHSGPSTVADTSSHQTAEAQPTLQDKQMQASFIMDTFEDSMEIPHTKVTLDYNDSRTALDPMLCAGTLYDKQQMKDMEIPDDAITACGGWYAGGGDYYYIVPTATGIAVYKGYQDEEQEDAGYHWEKVKEIN